MKNETWIPKQNEFVEYKDKIYKVVSMKFSGACTLKETRSRKVIKDVHVNDLQKLEK
jgi:hypothetical protein